jgi:hypothetical protein
VAWFYVGAWVWSGDGWSQTARHGPELMPEGTAHSLFRTSLGWLDASGMPAYAGIWRWTDQGWQLEDVHQNF